MSKSVAEVLVGVLEQIGVRHIFGLIGDSLNPLADAVRRSKIDWIGVRHEEGAALAAAGQAKLTGQLGCAPAPPVRAATIWLPASMKRTATTRRCSPARCRARCKGRTSSRPPRLICCFATCRSKPKPFRRRHKRQP
jgi:Thiamine pyrophosphate enzyme, N-terminal TPP binding domain